MKPLRKKFLGGLFLLCVHFRQNALKKSHEFVSIYKPRPDLLIFYRGGGYDKVRKVPYHQKGRIGKPVGRLRRKAGGPVWAASCTLLCGSLQLCGNVPAPPKGSWCGVMEKFMGVAFPGTTITLPLRSGRLKYR